MTEELIVEEKTETLVSRKALVFAIGSVAIVENKKAAEELLNGMSKRYSAPLSGRGTRRAISVKDERKYPELEAAVDASFSSNDWIAKSNEFWSEFGYNIPFATKDRDTQKFNNAIIIDASYTIALDGKIYTENFEQFLLYELLKQDETVAKSLDLYEQRSMYDYFMIDIQEQEKLFESLTKEKEEAMIEFSRLISDKEKMTTKKSLIRGLIHAINPMLSTKELHNLTDSQKSAQLMKGATDKPAEFLKAVKNPDIAIVGLINDAVEAQVISKRGSKYYYDGEEYSHIELVAFLKDTTKNGLHRRQITDSVNRAFTGA